MKKTSFMEDFEVIYKAEHTQQFLTQLNSLNPHIQFTAEVPNKQGATPFVDTLVSLGPSGPLITSVHRKPTQTDQYLHWDSHHCIFTKCSLFNTHADRTQTICSDQELLRQDQQCIRTSLSRCNYPDWVFHRLQTKLDFQLSCQDHNTNHRKKG